MRKGTEEGYYRMYPCTAKKAMRAWRDECWHRKIPMVEVTTGPRYSTVRWDADTMDYQEYTTMHGLSRDVCHALFGIFSAVAGEKSEYSGGSGHGVMMRIPIEMAERAARAIAWTLVQQRRESKSRGN